MAGPRPGLRKRICKMLNGGGTHISKSVNSFPTAVDHFERGEKSLHQMHFEQSKKKKPEDSDLRGGNFRRGKGGIKV